ncbi:MAG TPA: hypothetical protein VGL26_11635 [Jatrophihabitans sp.]|jgi:hypothetical protein
MPTRRRLLALLAGVLVVLLVVLGVRLIWHKAKNALTYPHCTVTQPASGGSATQTDASVSTTQSAGEVSYDVTTDQAAVASTMVGVVAARGLPDQAAVLVLAAAWQESKLRNLPAGSGDRDSIGVLQQRPSQGWGSEEQLSDVQYATGKFLDALVKFDDWQTVPLAEAIQRVQISADGSAYNQHADQARVLALALLGKPAESISCTFDKPTLVATAQTVADQVAGDLPVKTPTVQDDAVLVPGAGNQTIAWFIANADRLGIDSVQHGRREWSRAQGWGEINCDCTEYDKAVAAIMATTAPTTS